MNEGVKFNKFNAAVRIFLNVCGLVAEEEIDCWALMEELIKFKNTHQLNDRRRLLCYLKSAWVRCFRCCSSEKTINKISKHQHQLGRATRSYRQFAIHSKECGYRSWATGRQQLWSPIRCRGHSISLWTSCEQSTQSYCIKILKQVWTDPLLTIRVGTTVMSASLRSNKQGNQGKKNETVHGVLSSATFRIKLNTNELSFNEEA